MSNPREESQDRVILAALSEMGATTFYQSLSRVCSTIAMACPVTTDREKQVRDGWVALAVRADVAMGVAEGAQIGSPFVFP